MAENKEIRIPSLVKIGAGKMRNIGKYLYDRNFMRAALFFSDGIEPVVAQPLYDGLKEWGIQIVLKDHIADINIENVVQTAFQIPVGGGAAGTNVLLGIGGGKALDYSKYCAHLLKLPFISVPTSVSNDGICSPNTSLFVGGRRKSINSTMPYGIVADLDIIAGAPKGSFYSGLGDIASKVTALWDWDKAFKKGLDSDNDFAALISHNSVDILCAGQGFDLNGEEFLYKLTNSLVLSGIAMEIAGSSRPASGSEHLISHALDAYAKKPAMHGLQVGAAAYLCSLLQNNKTDMLRNFLTDTGFIAYAEQHPIDKGDFINALEKAPSMKQDYYTILSEPDSYERGLEFLETDELLKKLVK